MIDQKRLEIANQVLGLICAKEKMSLVVIKNRLCLRWQSFRGEWIQKKWECRSGSFHPTIYQQVPTGGTYITAIAQLVRWIKHKPCLPIQNWKYWCSEKVGMKPIEIVSILEKADYPSDRRCLACQSMGFMDWYSFGKTEGLGCYRPCEPLKLKLEEYWSKKK